MKKANKRFREFLIRRTDELIPDKDSVAVFLSGGIDSCVALFCCLELGMKPVCYTFKVKGIPNEDYKAAIKVAKTFRLDIVKVICPNDINTIKRDVISLARDYGCRIKVEFEPLWPFLYVSKKLNERYVTNGWGADCVCGITKVAVLGHKVKESKTNLHTYWKEQFAQDREIYAVQKMCRENGAEIVFIFWGDPIVEHCKKMSWQQLNEGKHKGFLINSFEDYFMGVRVRQHASLQIEAGIRELFLPLLKTELNTTGTTSMIHFYRNVVRQYATSAGRLV